MDQTPDLERLIAFFHELTPESIGRFPEFYSADAYFKDPFNEVRGIDAIQHIFRHMFQQVEAPHFVITERVADANGVMLGWTFCFRARLGWRNQTQFIRGVSHLKFTMDGKVNYHRDYWDAAEELYMKLPVAGGMMRYLKNAFACKQVIG